MLILSFTVRVHTCTRAHKKNVYGTVPVSVEYVELIKTALHHFSSLFILYEYSYSSIASDIERVSSGWALRVAYEYS